MLENAMTYELLEHEADIGVKGIGATLEEAFQEGAKAMFSVMVDLDKVDAKESVDVHCESDSIEMLFVEFLNRLLADMTISEMVFSKFEVKISKGAPGLGGAGAQIEKYTLTGKAFGEPLDQDKHQTKTEVKAATLHGIKYEKTEEDHQIQCVVDV
jgi:tRNA nucleotidyltransferase (CCA-adding enzyme)|tara:strand:- start:191 stop:658 length:468 start_codon:yes stop_codon:yes gene_type:complete